VKKYTVLLGQLLILSGISWIGTQLALLTGLPVPGNVLGLLLLLGMLVGGVIKLSHVQEASDLLLKHMLLLFIPVVVGLMDMGRLLYNNALIFTVAIVISSVLPFLLVGFITQLLGRRKKNCNT